MKLTTIIFLIFLGGFFWLSNYHLITFSRDWPVILIVIGLLAMIKRPRGKKIRVEVKTDDDDKMEVLKDLEKGEISAEEAEERMKEE